MKIITIFVLIMGMAFCMHAQNRQQVKTDEAVRAALCRINHTFLPKCAEPIGRNLLMM